MDTECPQRKDGARQNQIVKNLKRYFQNKNHETLHQQRDIHEEPTQQQQQHHQRNLRAEESLVASQSSMHENAEFQEEYDASAEKDEFHKVQMEQFAFQVEEKMEYKRSLYGKELRRREDSHIRLVIFSRGRIAESTYGVFISKFN